MVDLVKIVKDTAGSALSGGKELVAIKTIPSGETIFWVLFGLVWAIFYFYLQIKDKNNKDPQTWKGYWVVNKKLVITHLIVYFAVIFVWITEGGSLIGNFLSDILKTLSPINVDSIADKIAYWFTRLMPQGDLNLTTGLFGFFTTVVIEKLPVLAGIIKEMARNVKNIKLFGGKP